MCICRARLTEVLSPVPQVGSKEDEWHADAEPEHQQSEHGSEGNRAGRLFAPDEKVEHTKYDEDDALKKRNNNTRDA